VSLLSLLVVTLAASRARQGRRRSRR